MDNDETKVHKIPVEMLKKAALAAKNWHKHGRSNCEEAWRNEDGCK